MISARSSAVGPKTKMHLFSALAFLGFAAIVTAQGSAGGSQASCSAHPWTPLGCYDDNNNGRHAGFTWQLQNSTTDPKYYPGFVSDQMTVDICTRACRGHGLQYASIYAGTHCYCGVNFPLPTETTNTASGPGTPPGSSAGTPTDASACNTPCQGNSSQTCGGAGTSSIYQDPSFSAITPSTQSASNYAYVGCYSYVSPGPSYKTFRTTSTSACQTYCGLIGYPFSARSGTDLATDDDTCGCSPEIQAGTQIDENSCANHW